MTRAILNLKSKKQYDLMEKKVDCRVKRPCFGL